MKNLYLTFSLFTSLLMYSQTTIIEGKISKENTPVGYSFLSDKNKLIIQKGEHVSISKNRKITSLLSYDNKGNMTPFLENIEAMNPYFSVKGNTVRLVDYSKMSYTGSTYKIIKDGKITKSINIDPHYNYVTDNYQFNIENQKGKTFDIDFEKNDLFLDVMDLATLTSKKIQLEKPSIDRLKGDNYYNLKKGVGFTVYNDWNDHFEIVTKSVSKDCNQSTIYRTLYDFNGNKLKEIVLPLSLPNNTFMLSMNGGGKTESKSLGSRTYQEFIDVLSINNFIFDKNENIYVYGIMGQEGKKNILMNRATGIYVFKFDKEGKKIWEQFIAQDEINRLGGAYLSRTMTALAEINNKLVFNLVTTSPDELSLTVDLDKVTGNKISSNTLEFKEEIPFSIMSGNRYFLIGQTKLKNLKNKVLSYSSLLLYNNNKSVADYINSVNSKEDVHFESVSSSEGIWLLESDNEAYYKVSYFNN